MRRCGHRPTSSSWAPGSGARASPSTWLARCAGHRAPARLLTDRRSGLGSLLRASCACDYDLEERVPARPGHVVPVLHREWRERVGAVARASCAPGSLHIVPRGRARRELARQRGDAACASASKHDGQPGGRRGPAWARARTRSSKTLSPPARHEPDSGLCTDPSGTAAPVSGLSALERMGPASFRAAGSPPCAVAGRPAVVQRREPSPAPPHGGAGRVVDDTRASAWADRAGGVGADAPGMRCGRGAWLCRLLHWPA